MLRVKDALNYVEFEGTDLDRYRSRFLFRGERDDTMAAWLLGAYQNPDGGYPLHLVYGEPSNLSETARIVGYAAEFEVVDSAVCRRAIEYLTSRQHQEGFWQEHGSQLELGEEMGGEWGRLWLSAFVGRELCRAGQHRLPEMKKLRSYLLPMREGKERFSSSPAICYLVMGFFALLEGPESQVVTDSLDFALSNFTSYQEPRLITLEARCLLDAGVNPKDRILVQAGERLIKLQAEDGGWGEAYAGLRVRTTLDVLKLLEWLGTWRIPEEV